MINSEFKVSHVTIANYANKFTTFFKQKAYKLKTNLDLQPDDLTYGQLITIWLEIYGLIENLF